jgi:hypothetical protein
MAIVAAHESNKDSRHGPVPAYQNVIAIAIRMKCERKGAGELKDRRTIVVPNAAPTEVTANP